MPRPHRSSTNQDKSAAAKEVSERDYEQRVILTDQTRKQFTGEEMLDSAGRQQLYVSPDGVKQSMKEDRTTERKGDQRRESAT